MQLFLLLFCEIYANTQLLFYFDSNQNFKISKIMSKFAKHKNPEIDLFCIALPTMNYPKLNFSSWLNSIIICILFIVLISIRNSILSFLKIEESPFKWLFKLHQWTCSIMIVRGPKTILSLNRLANIFTLILNKLMLKKK